MTIIDNYEELNYNKILSSHSAFLNPFAFKFLWCFGRSIWSTQLDSDPFISQQHTRHARENLQLLLPSGTLSPQILCSGLYWSLYLVTAGGGTLLERRVDGIARADRDDRSVEGTGAAFSLAALSRMSTSFSLWSSATFSSVNKKIQKIFNV